MRRKNSIYLFMEEVFADIQAIDFFNNLIQDFGQI